MRGINERAGRPQPGCSAAVGAGALGRVARDDRGAILVLGIFMCACMVGLLWYLAGIGDAIVYRERMQSGADAVAFSGAVLHARGMNLIVLINLIMAAILGIRVMLRAVSTVLFVVGAILTAIPLPPTVALGQLAIQTGRVVEQTNQQLRNAINQSIKALSAVQRGIARIVPPASIAGSIQVANKYKPLISSAAAGSPKSIINGLPAVDGSEDKLCQMAGEAFASILLWKAPVSGKLANEIEGFLGKAVRAGGAYFCEIGGGGSPPDFSDELNKGAERGCNEREGALQTELSEADTAYRGACSRLGAKCDGTEETGLTPQDTAELQRLKMARDAKERELRDFDRDKCIEEQRDKINQGYKDATQGAAQSQSSTGQGMTPKRVKDGWFNGINDAQVLSVAVGDTKFLNISPRGVRAGSWKTNVEDQTPQSAKYTLAQAEFFFDCAGSWGGNACNGPNANDSDAMWQFRWRARLRRFNAPFGNNSGLDDLAGALAGGEVLLKVITQVDLASTATFQNASLLLELGNVIRQPDELIIH